MNQYCNSHTVNKIDFFFGMYLLFLVVVFCYAECLSGNRQPFDLNFNTDVKTDCTI